MTNQEYDEMRRMYPKYKAALDYIEDNAQCHGGGHGFWLRVFIPVDSECITGAIIEAAGKPKTTPIGYFKRI